MHTRAQPSRGPVLLPARWRHLLPALLRRLVVVVVVSAAAVAPLVWHWWLVVVVGLFHHVVSVIVGHVSCGHGHDDTVAVCQKTFVSHTLVKFKTLLKTHLFQIFFFKLAYYQWGTVLCDTLMIMYFMNHYLYYYYFITNLLLLFYIFIYFKY